jgi:hypothetical protein
MEAISSSETLVTTYKTTRHHNPEDHDPHFHSRENLKSDIEAREFDFITKITISSHRILTPVFSVFCRHDHGVLWTMTRSHRVSDAPTASSCTFTLTFNRLQKLVLKNSFMDMKIDTKRKVMGRERCIEGKGSGDV